VRLVLENSATLLVWLLALFAACKHTLAYYANLYVMPPPQKKIIFLHRIRHLRVETRKHSEFVKNIILKQFFGQGGGRTAEITDILKDPNVALFAAWTVNI
jgi:hypothetical protein